MNTKTPEPLHTIHIEELEKAEDILSLIGDVINNRISFIASTIAEFINPGNSNHVWYHYEPDGLQSFKLKLKFFEYALELDGDYDQCLKINGEPAFLICLEDGTSIDMLKQFPTVWLFDDSFKEELIASRERQLQRSPEKPKPKTPTKRQLIQSAISKLTPEEIAAIGL